METRQTVGFETPSLVGPTFLLDRPVRRRSPPDTRPSFVPNTVVMRRRAVPGLSVATLRFAIDRIGSRLAAPASLYVVVVLHSSKHALAKTATARNRFKRLRVSAIETYPTA